jgi:hypothetical protein
MSHELRHVLRAARSVFMAASCECAWLACHALFVRICKRRFLEKVGDCGVLHVCEIIDAIDVMAMT